MEIHKDHSPEEATLPPVPEDELLALRRGRVIRAVKSVYTDVVCEPGVLERFHGTRLPGPRPVAELLFELVGRETQECFVALLLDGKHKLSGIAQVSRGTLTASLVHPREVFSPAIRELAAAVVVAHNHPSGDPEPSAEDLAVTERLRQAGEVLGIPLLDHVVVGSSADRFVSIRERLKL